MKIDNEASTFFIALLMLKKDKNYLKQIRADEVLIFALISNTTDGLNLWVAISNLTNTNSKMPDAQLF
jgi:hypothetical protein